MRRFHDISERIGPQTILQSLTCPEISFKRSFGNLIGDIYDTHLADHAADMLGSIFYFYWHG